jgi:hypothetical protein
MSSDMSAVAARTDRMRPGTRDGGQVGLLSAGLSVTCRPEFSKLPVGPTKVLLRVAFPPVNGAEDSICSIRQIGDAGTFGPQVAAMGYSCG